MRPALTILLLLAAFPALAEWVKVARTDAAVHYVDPVTLHSEGGLRRVWAMQDLLDADSDGVRSFRSLQEYDCAREVFRYLALVAYGDAMARGAILMATGISDEWNGRPPGTRPSAIEKLACNP